MKIYQKKWDLHFRKKSFHQIRKITRYLPVLTLAGRRTVTEWLNRELKGKIILWLRSFISRYIFDFSANKVHQTQGEWQAIYLLESQVNRKKNWGNHQIFKFENIGRTTYWIWIPHLRCICTVLAGGGSISGSRWMDQNYSWSVNAIQEPVQTPSKF